MEMYGHGIEILGSEDSDTTTIRETVITVNPTKSLRDMLPSPQKA